MSQIENSITFFKCQTKHKLNVKCLSISIQSESTLGKDSVKIWAKWQPFIRLLNALGNFCLWFAIRKFEARRSWVFLVVFVIVA